MLISPQIGNKNKNVKYDLTISAIQEQSLLLKGLHS